MATRDPNFWKRFSVAVHQDDLAREEMSQQKTTHGSQSEPKHSYVSSYLSSAPTSPTTFASPTSSTSPETMFSAASPNLTFSFPADEKSIEAGLEKDLRIGDDEKPKRPRSKLQKTPSQRPLIRPTPSHPAPTNQKHTSIYTTTTTTTPSQPPPSPLPLTSPYPSFPTSNPPLTPPRAFFSSPLGRHTNQSSLSLNLSTRPPSRFKFWTTISADPPPRRDSWLAGQKRKARQRMWLCWLFWGVLGVVVAAVVVTVVVLKGKGIL